ncbi:MAG: DUF1573 domain-containing protein [Saprospiraceae bacterium]
MLTKPYKRIITGALFFLSALPFVSAQEAWPDYRPEWRSALSRLNAEQKDNLLEYFLQKPGGDADERLSGIFEKLPTDRKRQALRYAEFLGRNPVTPQTRAIVRWEKDTLYLGQVEEGTILLDSFAVTNIGMTPYVIKEVKTACDCAVLRYPERPIAPGETYYLRVEFDTIRKAGRATPGFVVYDNSQPNSRNILYLDTFITPRKPLRAPKQ